jgi:hypothetical protein
MRQTFITILCVMGLCSGFPEAAHADYPWCVGTLEGRVDCSFSTYEQCQGTASGIGSCFKNLRALGSDEPPRPPLRTRRPRSR